MPSVVSQPLGPIYVCMSRAAGDAFNTAASDDTDPMRQTEGQTSRSGGRKAVCREKQTSPHAQSQRGHLLQYLGLLCLCQIQWKKKEKSPGLADAAPHWVLHIFTAYGQIYMCVRKSSFYGSAACLFRSVCMHVCTLCVCLWAMWTPSSPYEILKSEDGDVRVLQLTGDVSWSSAGLWTVVMVLWPTHSLLPCSLPPSHHHTCIATEQMTFKPETISSPDSRTGVLSRCTARTKQL